MALKPIPESQAVGEIKEYYETIKEAFGLTRLPLFFTYFGPFPNYLQHITAQITANLVHSQFQNTTEEAASRVQNLIHDSLPTSEEINKWLQRYKNSPSFYYFQNDLRTIHLTNIKLSFIFIALRETLKGWAIAAKKLSGSNAKPVSAHHDVTIRQEHFIFEDISNSTPASSLSKNEDQHDLSASANTHSLMVRNELHIEQDLLPRYLGLCRTEFSHLMKTDQFWVMRVGIEEMMLTYLQILPEVIFSPINQTLKLTETNPDSGDLLYLISEYFPTYAVHRMLFSGYMLL